jgi:3-phosphoshikimate 1-carboxyvinyltransferase
MFCAALARGESRIGPTVDSKDIMVSLDAIRFLGAEVEESHGAFAVRSAGLAPKGGELDLHESGSTLRFAIPLILCSSVAATLTGRDGLSRRPLGPYRELFSRPGLVFRQPPSGSLPLELRGPLKSGDFVLPGDVSSQFVTGLLLALPLLPGRSRIILSTRLESAAYAQMTLAALAGSGIRVETLPADASAGAPFGGWAVEGPQAYRAGSYRPEADWSSAAIWVAANAMGGSISLGGLDPLSLQPDRAIADICRDSPSEIDVSGCPDLLPILSVWAGTCGHPVKIRGAARVRIKECDRVAAMAKELRAIGGRVRELPDGLDIEPVDRYEGGRADGWNDHRVVMSLAVASLASRNAISIEGPEAVAKSYPGFFDDFRALGGDCHVE